MEQDENRRIREIEREVNVNFANDRSKHRMTEGDESVHRGSTTIVFVRANPIRV